jgi:hypothetical protein
MPSAAGFGLPSLVLGGSPGVAAPPWLDARPLIEICAPSLLMELLAGRPGAMTIGTGIDRVSTRQRIWVGVDVG